MPPGPRSCQRAFVAHDIRFLAGLRRHIRSVWAGHRSTRSILVGLVNGPAAVTFFFVLSGFVLTRRYFKTGDVTIIARSAVKRWPRLAGPVLLTVLASWALFAAGLYCFQNAAGIIGSPWLEKFAFAYDTPFIPSFRDALEQGAFFTLFRGDCYYDSSLWTMRYELIGSFMAFGLALLLRPLENLAVCAFLVGIAPASNAIRGGLLRRFPHWSCACFGSLSFACAST